MILAHDFLAIFSFPRTGTKLISNVLQQQGYHNHGEWYDVWSSTVTGQTAHRQAAKTIKHNQELLLQNIHSADYIKLAQTIDRHNQLQLYPRSVITIWYENAINFPWLFMQLNNHHWICPRRDIWQQLASFMVSWHNNNFDGQSTSKPVEVNMRWFEIFFWRWHYVQKIQAWLVNSGRGTYVEFDDLIQGQANTLGNYIVTTLDEHELPERLIMNILDVKSRFEFLCRQVQELGK